MPQEVAPALRTLFLHSITMEKLVPRGGAASRDIIGVATSWDIVLAYYYNGETCLKRWRRLYGDKSGGREFGKQKMFQTCFSSMHYPLRERGAEPRLVASRSCVG